MAATSPQPPSPTVSRRGNRLWNNGPARGWALDTLRDHYYVRPPRSVDDALNNILGDTDLSLRRIFDAMRTYAQWAARVTRDPQVTPADNDVILGHLDMWTYAACTAVIANVFGPTCSDDLVHAIAVWREVPVPDCDDLFFLKIAILVKGGYRQWDEYRWQPRAAPGDYPLNTAMHIVGAWDRHVLDVCTAAGLTVDELEAMATSGQLPEPDTLKLLISLR